MKLKKFVMLAMMLMFSAAGIIPAAAQDDRERTIADIVMNANENGEFTLLLRALAAADLVEALSDPDARLTVFAPTDAAFEQLLQDLDISVDELLARADLEDMLLYHVVDTDLTLDDLRAALGFSQRLFVETQNGASFTVRVVDDTVLVNDAQVVRADGSAVNGVLHGIDRVLMPTDENENVFEASNALSGTMSLEIGGQNLTITVDEAYINLADAVDAALGEMDGINLYDGGASGVLQISIPGGLNFSVSFGDEGLSFTGLPTAPAPLTDADARLSGIVSFRVNNANVPVRIVSAGVDLRGLMAFLPVLNGSDFEIDDISGDFEVLFSDTASVSITLDEGEFDITPANP